MKYLGISDFNEILNPNIKEILWLGNSSEYYNGIKWCQKGNIEYKLLNDIWEKKDDVLAARDYVENLVSVIIRKISLCLNRLHHTDYTEEEWTLLLRHWLLFYISTMYDKYVKLKFVNETGERYYVEIPQYEEWILSHSWDVFDELNKKPYHLYQYLELISNMSFLNITRIKSSNLGLQNYILEWKNRKPRKLLKYNIHGTLRKIRHAKVLIYHCFLPQAILRAERKSFGKVIDFSFVGDNLRIELDNLDVRIDNGIRKTLFFELGNDYITDEFAQYISRQVVVDIPYVFVEGWHELISLEKKYFSFHENANLIMTHSYYTDIFRLYVVFARKKGAKLAEVQHGGNFGITLAATKGKKFYQPDIFYTWGWKYTSYPCEFRPMPAAKLLDINSIAKKTQVGEKILYTNSSGTGMYTTFYSYESIHFDKFEQIEVDFFERLDKRLKEKIVFRMYMHVYGKGQENLEYIKKRNPEMIFDNRRPFYEELSNCRMLITNKISTTYLEALAINKPCIIFCPMEFYDFENEAVEWMDRLQKVGILQDSYISAAELLNEIYDDIERWWLQPERQKVVSEFVEHYAYQVSNGVDIWEREILSWCK